MTTNQLKYWELRWKQHYENILAQVKVAEVVETKRHNVAVETETARHNRREERIDTQNMIINRGNLEARWAELEEKVRAAIVAEGLKEKEYQLQVQKVLYDWEYKKAEISNMLQSRKLAAADFAVRFVESFHKTSTEYMKAEAALLKAGWDKALVGEVVTDVKSLMAKSEYDKVLQNAFGDDPEFSWLVEAFGPATGKEVANMAGKKYNEPIGPKQPQQYFSQKAKNIKESIGLGISKPEDAKNLVQGFSGTQQSSRDISGVTSESTGNKVGSTKDIVETKTPSGTRVIYSSGSHYGPGFQI